MENDLKFVKSVIYRLKRAYGGPVELYCSINSGTDLATGETQTSVTKFVISRAIRLPKDIYQNALFNSMGNRLFNYGNFIELADRNIIIDWRDLPSGINLGDNYWYIIIEGHRYDIVKFSEFDNKAAMFFVLKELYGAPREQIIDVNVKQGIDATQTATGTV